MSTTLVIGASRGIGLEICRQLKQRGEQIIATCRTPSTELDGLGVTIIGDIDVANSKNIEQLASVLKGTRLDLLIHNAGILTSEPFDDLNYNRILKQFEVNTLGPLRVVHALADNLSPGAKVGIVSSRVGSLDDNGSGGMYGYRISKAAVNMVGVNLAHDLRSRDIAVILLHPGLVSTDMTGGRGIDRSVAAGGIIERIDDLTMENTGTFWHAEGYQLPW